MMPSFTDLVPSHWPVGDWPTTAPNTTQTLEHVQAVSPMYLAALYGVAFIIWLSLAMIAWTKTGDVSTKRLLVLVGMAVTVVALRLLSGEGSVSPLIDAVIVTVAWGALLLLAVAVSFAMPIATACAVLVIGVRLIVRHWGKPKRERSAKATGILSEGGQS